MLKPDCERDLPSWTGRTVKRHPLGRLGRRRDGHERGSGGFLQLYAVRRAFICLSPSDQADQPTSVKSASGSRSAPSSRQTSAMAKETSTSWRRSGGTLATRTSARVGRPLTADCTCGTGDRTPREHSSWPSVSRWTWLISTTSY